MASSEEFRNYVIDQSGLGEDIMARKMMGEYLLYFRGKHIGGIYDNRLLLKKTAANAGLGLSEAIPYESAKPMLIVDADDCEKIRNAILTTAEKM